MCVVAGMVLAVAPAAAAPMNDEQACANTPAEAAIPFCTRAIASGRYKGHDLAGIYQSRLAV
jgi:hypothetical protein